MIRILIGILCLFALISCLKDDTNNVGGEINLQPEFAIPVGTVDSKISDYVDGSTDMVEIDFGQLDTIPGFYYDSILYKIPLKLSYSKNIPFTLSSSENEDTIVTRLMIRTNIRNGIPAKIVLQAYFLDALGNVIDSLYDSGPFNIESAEINTEGEVTKVYSPDPKEVEFELSDIEKLTDVNGVLLETQLQIENVLEVNTQYFSEQSFWIQLAAEVKLNIKL